MDKYQIELEAIVHVSNMKIPAILLHITMNPDTLLDQVDGFLGKLVTVINEALYQKLSEAGKIDCNIGVQLFCDSHYMYYGQVVSLPPSVKLRSEIEKMLQDLKTKIRNELSLEMLVLLKCRKSRIALARYFGNG